MVFISISLTLRKSVFSIPLLSSCIAGFSHFHFALLNLLLMSFLINSGSSVYIMEETLTCQLAASTFLFVSVMLGWSC